MKTTLQLVLGLGLLVVPAAHASIIEFGDLNYINQPGNPSDGLQYLDMSFSVGKSASDAISNAITSYPDARFATPSEFDDLFAASSIGYDKDITASDGFSTGPSKVLSKKSYDGGELMLILGMTSHMDLTIWTIPDGNTDITTTRDIILFGNNMVVAHQSGYSPPWEDKGWLIVSETAPIPEPSSIGIWSLLGWIGLLAVKRQRRKRV